MCGFQFINQFTLTLVHTNRVAMMLARIIKFKNGWQTRGNGVLLWACLLSLICGVLEFGLPLENMMRYARNELRPQKASGDIVVVGFDGRSLNETKQRWPWPRTDLAKMIDELNQAGAKRIFFDFTFASYTDAKNDMAMIAAMKRAQGKMFLATRFLEDQSTGQRSDHVNIPEFAALSEGANINMWIDPFGVPLGFLYQTEVGGKTYRSMAAILADVSGETDKFFRADYAIKASSIPKISAVDVLRGRTNPAIFSGKDVIIASSTIDIGDMYRLPGAELTSGVYFNVLAAETLKRGIPVDYSWFGPWLIGIVTTAAFMRSRRKMLRRSIFGLGVVGLITIPLLLEQNLIFVQTVPALLAFAIVGIARARANFRKQLHDSGITNNVSGLFNLSALNEATARSGATLIAMKVHNYLAIKATFPAEREKELIDQIISRISLGVERANLYQSDDGAFVWLADDVTHATAVERIDALHSIFRGTIKIGDQSVNLFVTFGIDRDETRSLPNRASAAILASDEGARNGDRWSLSNADKSKERAAQLFLVGRIDEAIANGEIWVAYQPKLDIKSNRICGAEALVRWTHPDRGAISPNDFIMMAEEQDRIDNLTLHVLENAIKTSAAINNHGVDFEIAANLSPRAFAGLPIDAIASAMLAKYALPARCLTLEITETATMRPNGEFIAVLERLRAIGINISVDDYGTGLSTLEYLRAIPSNEVKIDRSLISQIDFSPESRMIVNSTIQMVHSLGRSAVAEGVESEAVLKLISQMGCDKAQGYLIARPMRFRELWHMIGATPKRTAA
jgi:diguanylate cyclase